MNTVNQLPEPELGYIKTDKSNQPAFSARQMREMKDTNQLPPLPTPKFTEAIRGVPCITLTEHEHLMRAYALQAIARSTQAEVTDAQINAAYLAWCKTNGTPESFARAILALRPERVPMTNKQAIEMNDAAFDKYMTQDARAIELVRSVEAYYGIKPKDQA